MSLPTVIRRRKKAFAVRPFGYVLAELGNDLSSPFRKQKSVPIRDAGRLHHWLSNTR